MKAEDDAVQRPEIHHLADDRETCAVCGDEWPCLSFLLTIGASARAITTQREN